MSVELTVHVLVQMSLEWPRFDNLQHGRAILAMLPKIEELTLDPEPTGISDKPRSRKKSFTRARWSYGPGLACS